MKPEELLEGLNPPQREAVLHEKGPLLILAGAGSGKTRVLTHRIAYLVGRGVRPDRILAVTFTNKSAGEMRERVERLLSAPLDGFWVSTFHSASLRILRREGPRLGLPRDFVVLDEKDSLDLIRRAIADLKLDEEMFPPRQIQHRIDRAKGEGKGPGEFLAPDFPGAMNFGNIYAAYQSLMREVNGLDFGDLLLNTVELFKNHPDILRRYQTQFSHIMVDEYQDTNRVQYLFLELLNRVNRNLCVVGDEDQSIYRWRGADLNNILDFERDFPEAKIIRLEQNYRSTRSIIRASSALIEKNQLRKGKTLWTEREDGHPVLAISSRSERNEAASVAHLVEHLFSEDRYAPGDLAVFYRTNAQSRPIEDELSRRRVPYQLVGSLRFYERKEIKDSIAYLRAVLNPEDSLSLRRIINVPARGIGKQALTRAEEIRKRDRVSLSRAFRRGLMEKIFPPASSRRIENFFHTMEMLRNVAAEESLPNLIHRILDETGYVEALEHSRTEESRGRLENLGELINAARDFWERGEGGVVEYLDQVALVNEVDELQDSSRTVKLLTLHNAKGLEFPVVLIVGIEEGLLPHAHSLREPEELEEERRLFYVGMTRAKERLYLFSARERRFFGISSLSKPSRFLLDIPPEFLEMVVQP